MVIRFVIRGRGFVCARYFFAALIETSLSFLLWRGLWNRWHGASVWRNGGSDCVWCIAGPLPSSAVDDHCFWPGLSTINLLFFAPLDLSWLLSSIASPDVYCVDVSGIFLHWCESVSACHMYMILISSFILVYFAILLQPWWWLALNFRRKWICVWVKLRLVAF